MKALTLKNLTLAMCASSALLLAACNDDDNNSSNNNNPPAQTQKETINGTAATGKAFGGKIIVKNKDGAESSAVDIKADGTFSVEVPKGAPYLIKASNNQTGDQLVELYSYLADASKKVNATQLTTQAVYDANAQKKLADLYADWAKQTSNLTQAKIDASAKKVAANLQAKFATELANLKIDAKSLNIFNVDFKAANGFTVGTGLDKILDQIKITGFNNCNVSSCSVKYTVNGVDYTNSWNYNISTDGYNLVVTNSDGGFGGNYNLKVTTSVGGQGSSVTINNVPKPDNKDQFCAASNYNQAGLPAGFVISSCDFNGTVGNISANVNTQGISFSYTVKYEYTRA